MGAHEYLEKYVRSMPSGSIAWERSIFSRSGQWDPVDLIDAAVDAGCDAVKFQKRNIDSVYTSEFLAAPRESPWGNTQRDQKEGLEFGVDEYLEIDRYCKEKEIDWFASAWDLKSQAFKLS